MEKWLEWAIEIQSIAQIGLSYTTDDFDIQRYERLREISAEMIENKTDISLEKVKDLFCNEIGYKTPKLSTRAAVFKNNKILLVQEKNGEWALPGGLCDVLETVKSCTIKEVKEESGLDVEPIKIIAIEDGNKNAVPKYPFGVCKIFIECKLLGGKFVENIETIDSGFFSLDELPKNISDIRSSKEQIKMCFEAHNNPNWEIPFY